MVTGNSRSYFLFVRIIMGELTGGSRGSRKNSLWTTSRSPAVNGYNRALRNRNWMHLKSHFVGKNSHKQKLQLCKDILKVYKKVCV